MSNINEVMAKFKRPFHPSHVTWKPGAITKDQTKALAMAYGNLRAYQDRLDEDAGGEWSCSYTPWGERIVCNMTVCGVTRSSSGEPDSQAERSEIAGTAAEAQAFKRACAMFGLGRYLYSFPSSWMEYDPNTKKFTDKAMAKLDGIVAAHYQRWVNENQAKQPAQKPQAQPEPEPEPEHRNMTSHEDINRFFDEAEPMSDGHVDHPFNTPSKPVAQTKGLAWPSDGDSLEACASLINYDVPMSEAARKLTLTLQAKHKASKGKGLSDKQYKYLVGLVDKVTGDGSHRAVLSVVCGAVIGDASFPGWQCKELIDWLVAKNPAAVDAIKGVGDSIKNLVAA